MIKTIMGVVAAVGAFFTLEYWRRRAKVAEVKGVVDKGAQQDVQDTKAVVDAETARRAALDTAETDLSTLDDPNLKKL